MPTLLVDCPYTHRKFSTGVETTAERACAGHGRRGSKRIVPIVIRRTKSMCARLTWMARCGTPRRVLNRAFNPRRVGGGFPPKRSLPLLAPPLCSGWGAGPL
jgi:hypothetical protein